MSTSTPEAISDPMYPNGVTVSFPFNFDAPSADEVAAVLVDGNGISSLVSTSLYEVVLNDDGGTIEFSSPPASGPTLFALLSPSFAQNVNFTQGGGWIASVVNSALDRAAYRDRALQRDIDRCISFPVGESGSSLPSATSRAGMYLAFSASGAAVPSTGTGADAGLRADLAASTGLALIGLEGGGSVQDYLLGVSGNAFGVEATTELDGSGLPLAPVDQSASLQAAVDYAYANGIPNVFIRGNGVVSLGSTVEVPHGITIDGLNSRAENSSEYGQVLRFASMADGTYATEVSGTNVTIGVSGATDCQSGFLFFFNVDPADTSTWVRQFPNIGSGGLKNCSIDGTASGGISGAFFAGSHHFSNIRCVKVASLVKKPSIYTDGVVVHDVFGKLRANGTDYLIDLQGTGDAYDISNIHSGYTGDQTGRTKAVLIGLCRSGTVTRVVNGDSEFRNSQVTASEFHLETGSMTIDGGHVVVASNKLYHGEGLTSPLVIRNSATGSTLQSGTVVLRDNSFIHPINAVGDGEGWATTERLDILCEDTRMDITIDRGNRRSITTSGELSRNYIMAPLIGDSGGAYEDWEAHAHWLALSGTTINGGVVDVTGVMQQVDAAITLTTADYTQTQSNKDFSTFAAPTATYFYSVDTIADPLRKLGRTGAEVSKAATLDSATLPVIRLGFGSLRRAGGFIARIYRGTATGVRTEYADIPLIECKELIDSGEAVNGFAWKPNPSAPAKITLNNNAQNGILHYRMGVVEGYNITFNSNPSVGEWRQGDRLHIAGTATHEARLRTDSVAGVGTWVKLGIKGAEQAAAVAPAAAATYVAASGGATVDAEARAAQVQLAADVAAIRATQNSILTQLKTALLMAT